MHQCFFPGIRDYFPGILFSQNPGKSDEIPGKWKRFFSRDFITGNWVLQYEIHVWELKLSFLCASVARPSHMFTPVVVHWFVVHDMFSVLVIIYVGWYLSWVVTEGLIKIAYTMYELCVSIEIWFDRVLHCSHLCVYIQSLKLCTGASKNNWLKCSCILYTCTM